MKDFSPVPGPETERRVRQREMGALVHSPSIDAHSLSQLIDLMGGLAGAHHNRIKKLRFVCFDAGVGFVNKD